MRIHDIIDLHEAPLADFETLGDADKPGSFRADDLKAMRNPKWRAKVVRAFSKTPYRFNVYLLNGEDGAVPIEHKTGASIQVNNLENTRRFTGIHPLDTLVRLLGRAPSDAERSITVMLLQNEGDERVPMTPWIMAHRIAHAIFECGERGGGGYDSSFVRPIEAFDEAVRAMISSVADRCAELLPPEFSDIYKAESDPQVIKAIAGLIGTFASARNGQIDRPGEFSVELVAQYLMQGGVHFQRPVLKATDFGLQPTDALHRSLGRAEQKIDSVIGWLLDNCVGRCLVL